MNRIRVVLWSVFLISGLLVSESVHAGVPVNNLEGVGGIAFNPLAYPANAQSELYSCGKFSISKPQVGSWYVQLHDTDVRWSTTSAAITFFKRLEVSAAYEIINKKGPDIYKKDVGTKVLLLDENSFGTNFVPAVAIGGIWKKTSFDPKGVDDSGFDWYLVATKLIKELPVPVLVSGGLLSTKGQVTGVFGFNKHRDETFFANIDVIPLQQLAIGFEYKDGARYDNFKNADYWQVHLAWFPTKQITGILSYANAGNNRSTSRVGLGDGFVFSAHYAF